MTEEPSSDSWRVSYSFSEPVRGFRFLRKRNVFRADGWSLEDCDGCQWVEREGAEAVLASSSEGLTSVTLRFVSDFRNKPKDYELNLAFSEGSRLLYTGHLAVHPLVCRGGTRCEADEVVEYDKSVRHAWRFTTINGRDVRLLDQAGSSALLWKPTSEQLGEGTYVYFGSITPARDSRFTMIIDPGMPRWMVEKTRELVPKFFEHYASSTGVELDFRPLLFLSYQPGDANVGNLGGGTLDGLVQLAAIGGYWENKDQYATLAWFKFLAHESFHLWNGQMYRNRLGIAGEWLSEGSADYFAFRALRAHDLIDEGAFLQRVSTWANRCIASLRGEPLLTVHERGSYKSFYTCGATIQFLVDHMVQKATAGEKDLWAVWGRMFGRAKETDETYSTYSYLESIQEITSDAIATGPLERVLHWGVEGSVDVFLRDELAKVGVTASLVSPEKAGLEKDDYMSLLSQLLARCDCGLRRSVTRHTDHLEFHPLSECVHFRDGLKVSHVAGLSLREAAGDAYAAALAALQDGKPVSVTELGGGGLTFKCPADRVERTFTKLLHVETM